MNGDNCPIGAGLHAQLAALTCLRPGNPGVFVKGEIDLPQDLPRAGVEAGPAGLTQVRIELNGWGLVPTTKG